LKSEAKVGLFVVTALLMLFGLTTQVSEFAHMGREGYRIYALLDDASGLEKSAQVKMKGVEIGLVQDIALEGKKVKVALFVDRGVAIPKDSVVALRQASLLGTKYVDIEPGEQEPLPEGGVLTKQKIYASLSETSTTINEAAREFRAFIAQLREAMGGESGKDLKMSVANLRRITEDIQTILERNREDIEKSIQNLRQMGEKLAIAAQKFGRMSDKFAYTADNINKRLPDIMKRIDELTLYLRNSAKTLDGKLPEALDRFVAIEKDLQEVIAQNRKPLRSTLVNASDFFKKGSDSFQKLDRFFDTMGKSEIEVGFAGYYMSDDDYFKNSVSLNYIPTPNKYYMLEVVARDDLSSDRDGRRESDYKVSAMYGRRYGDMRFRLGLIESTGGVGVDYFFDNDRAKLRADIYDFNAVNDERGENAHLDMTLRYRFLKHLDAYVGVDNALNDRARNYVFGVGINFVDQDMKYLLGSMSGAGTYLK
jgi:phospholipid/cholesterol/gamma-HCH transport system substrate-binding protein